MDTKDISQETLDWLEAIEISPMDWVDGFLETMLDRECITQEEKDLILRRHQSLLD